MAQTAMAVAAAHGRGRGARGGIRPRSGAWRSRPRTSGGPGTATVRTTRATSRRDRSTSPTSAQLQVAWTYPFGDTGSSPIVVRGVIYGRGRNGSLVAVDATTGKELWVRENMNGMTSRGMNYWESADGRDQRLIFAMNSLLQEVDAKTGKSIMSFGTNGVVDLRVGIDGRDPATHRQHPVEHARRGLREPGHRRQRDRRRLHVAARRHPRLRRPHRQAGLDVPHRAASRRVRLRHVAEGRVEVHRRRQQLGRDDGRHRARHRLHPARIADLRLLRRRSDRRQPVRHVDRRARRAHRQAPVALPVRAPRSLGSSTRARRRS